jgi:putative toxin-antitoxin system antitoxin component (TIGR02293 family)
MSKTKRRPRPAPRSKGHPRGFLDLLGLDRLDALSLQRALLAGLPFERFAVFVRETGLTERAAAELVQITGSTLGRRKKEGRLSPGESERLYRVARIIDLAVELFDGNRPAALAWLDAPCLALGNYTPFQTTRTEVGAREVEHLIGRLEHGVFS